MVMEQLILQRLGRIGLRVYGKDTISQDTETQIQEAWMQNLCCKVKKFKCINALCLLK